MRRLVAEAAIRSLNAAWKRMHEAVWAALRSACVLARGATRRRSGTGRSADSGRSCGRPRRRGSSKDVRLRGGSAGAVIAPQDEPGDKCTVMHDLQELSGHVRARNRSAQDQFWKRVHDGIGPLDLRGKRAAVRHRAREAIVAEGRALGAGLGRGYLAMAFDGVCRCCAVDAAGHVRRAPASGEVRGGREPIRPERCSNVAATAVRAGRPSGRRLSQTRCELLPPRTRGQRAAVSVRTMAGGSAQSARNCPSG